MITIPTPSGTFGAFKPPEPKKGVSPWLYFGIFAIILLLGAAYFQYQGGGISFTAPVFTPASPLSALELKVSQLPAFNLSIFDGDFYRSLKIYGAIPVVADSLGRTNPFIPY